MENIKLHREDYVHCMDGKPTEGLDIIHHYTSVIDRVNEECFKGNLGSGHGEEWVRMTELPKDIQDKYLNYIIKNSEDKYNER